MFIKNLIRNFMVIVQSALPCLSIASTKMTYPQEKVIGKNKKCAISLTYTDEIKINNFLISLIDGKNSRTFAYPCRDAMAGSASYVPQIRNEFVRSAPFHKPGRW